MIKISNQYYYDAVRDLPGWRGRIYHYDDSGNKKIVVWISSNRFDTTEDAIDAAVGWAEENNIDVEMG